MEHSGLCGLILVIILIIWLMVSRSEPMVEIMWFHSTQCGHCINMEPEWDSFCESMVGSKVVTTKVNTAKNPALAAKYKIAAVPTVVKVSDGKKTVYEGPRTAPALKAFAAKK